MTFPDELDGLPYGTGNRKGPGKTLDDDNTVWDITTRDQFEPQSLAEWECRGPLAPHADDTDMWYKVVSGSLVVIVEPGIVFTLGPGQDAMIPAGRWTCSVPDRRHLPVQSVILNQPAFNPGTIVVLDPSDERYVSAYWEYATQKGRFGWD